MRVILVTQQSYPQKNGNPDRIAVLFICPQKTGIQVLPGFVCFRTADRFRCEKVAAFQIESFVRVC